MAELKEMLLAVESPTDLLDRTLLQSSNTHVDYSADQYHTYVRMYSNALLNAGPRTINLPFVARTIHDRNPIPAVRLPL